ncbi:MAG: hypothetical protein GWN99_01020 [Gemmatimonadetes bacterium]|uniref:Uncharacterized protein n=1 Tax=Candidatus Kutchimonas denitrificans TaxID=3056748 RepID=A0AAE4Z8A8_9BACT|nr:hypothetical protein [Gemmatimonadota bacterium]NIR75669.1 hypothetical protein [Candidatus Kutchimonas denitrificans]NIR99648.1 hypothetical protein [Gemmatimonadota bacterium]NIT65923.1 hypothetical protein [Gemmatimonadota bacterium]NIV22092.1 hypothetical protein [Gemmatimonadota bacterium]
MVACDAVRSGANRRRITENQVTDHLAQWSPDGRHLLFTSERGDREVVIIAHPDGTHPFQLATR